MRQQGRATLDAGGRPQAPPPLPCKVHRKQREVHSNTAAQHTQRRQHGRAAAPPASPHSACIPHGRSARRAARWQPAPAAPAPPAGWEPPAAAASGSSSSGRRDSSRGGVLRREAEQAPRELPHTTAVLSQGWQPWHPPQQQQHLDWLGGVDKGRVCQRQRRLHLRVHRGQPVAAGLIDENAPQLCSRQINRAGQGTSMHSDGCLLLQMLQQRQQLGSDR